MDGGVRHASFEDRWTLIAISKIGMPYQFGGDGKASTDCSQIVVDIFNRMGFVVEDQTADDFLRTFFTLAAPPTVGPVVGAIFRTDSHGKATHIGCIVGDRSAVLHATAAAGRVILQGLDQVKYDVLHYLDVRALIGLQLQPPPRQPMPNRG